jgi:hypothetical protein
MPVSGYPLPVDRTDETPMDDNHPLDHNVANAAINELSDLVDDLIAAPSGDVTEEDLTAAIDAAKTDLRDEFPVPGTTLAMTSGYLRIPATLASLPSAPPADHIDVIALTNESLWVQNSAGAATQLTPPFVSPTTMLATEAAVSTTTAADVLSVPVVANAIYDVAIVFGYEADNDGSTGIRFEFTVPASSAGHWRGEYINAANTGTSGTAAPTHLAKTWAQNSTAGGLSIGVAAAGRITGTLITAGTAGTFAWRARLSATGTAGKIYGMNTASYAGARMTLTRVA